MRFTTLREAVMLWYDRDADHLSAMVSYYALFATAPLLFLSITISGWLYGEAFVFRILTSWGSVLGSEVVGLLETAVINIRNLSGDFTLPIVGAIFFSGMVVVLFNTITSGLHNLWGIPHKGFVGWLRKCKRSVTFIIVVEVYLVVLLALTVLLPVSDVMVLDEVIRALFYMVANTILFSLAYRILPWERPSFKARFQGALVASVLLSLVQIFVARYLAFTPVPDLFDAAGIIIVLLIWLYATASVFYFGAAIAHVADKQSPTI